MALRARLDIEGLATDSAYYRVADIHWSAATPEFLDIRIDGYSSQENFQAGKNALYSIGVRVPTTERLFNPVRNQLSEARTLSEVIDSILKQSYVALKRDALAFLDAIDV